MVKIIRRNRTPYDCGLVAAFNAASWSNVYKPYEEIEKIARSCGYGKVGGIFPFQFSALLKKLKVPARKVRPSSIDDLESALYSGNMFVILYKCADRQFGHAIVLFLDKYKEIKLVNPEREGEILCWDDLASEIETCGMKEFHVYEIPDRKSIRMATRNDDT